MGANCHAAIGFSVYVEQDDLKSARKHHGEINDEAADDNDDDDDDGDEADDYSEYVHIADPDYDIKNMDDADEVVIDTPNISIVYDYPLRRHFTVSYDSESGFTRAQLVRLISDEYQNIYDVEEQTSSIEPALVPGWMNRNETNGTYGIYGHAIDDLLLHTICYDPFTHVVHLGIDS